MWASEAVHGRRADWIRIDGLKLDTTTFGEIIDELRDLHADAMREAKDSLPVLTELGHERKGEVDTDEIDLSTATGAAYSPSWATAPVASPPAASSAAASAVSNDAEGPDGDC